MNSSKVSKYKGHWFNRVILGDCGQVLGSLPEGSVHLVITSPPYNVGKDYDNHNDLLSYEDYLYFLENVCSALYRVLVGGGRVCLNVASITYKGEYKALYSDVISIMLSLGFKMRGEIIWDKQNISKRTAWGSWMSPSNPFLVQSYEFILVFSKDEFKLEGEKEKADISREEFIGYTNSLWKIKPETRKKEHPSPFPEELVYRLIKFYSFKGNTVLDPFAGSGTVGVVAKKLNRDFVLIDNSQKYVDSIRKNLNI